MTLSLLFLLFCGSAALALKRQRTMALAHNGQAPNQIRGFEEEPWHLDLHMDARQVFGGILASVTRFASRLLSWVSSLTKGGPKDDGQKSIAQPEEDEDETAIIQLFLERMELSLLLGKSVDQARSELRKKFPLDKALIQKAVERLLARKR